MWKPDTINDKEFERLANGIRVDIGRLENDVLHRSILTDITYDELFGKVEELYTILKLGDLAQDNKRRQQSERDRRG